MPFLGKDWRSSGDQWIKTEQGWQRMKSYQYVVDTSNIQPQPVLTKIRKISKTYSSDVNDATISDNDEEDIEFEAFNEFVAIDSTQRQAVIYLDGAKVAPNRENTSPELTISDVLINLDMMGAALELKRFNYVYKLTDLIIKEQFQYISGTAQSTLLMIINMMLYHVLRTRINAHLVKRLLIDFKKKIQDSYNENHIGSQKLWDRHLNLIDKWLKRLKNYEKKFWPVYSKPANITFETLPTECKFEILKRINCGFDLLNLSTCNKEFYDIISREMILWRNLCIYKFDRENILNLLSEQNVKVDDDKDEILNNNELDWKTYYFKLISRHKPHDVFVDIIQKCQHCKCLFWKESGHPCATTEEQEVIIETITPKKLIRLFLA